MTTGLPWRETADGIELTVRVTPRGGRARAAGIVDAAGRPALAVRVAAPPVDGAANAAVRAWIADALGIPGAAVRLTAGTRGRIKTFHLTGPDLPVRLAALVG